MALQIKNSALYNIKQAGLTRQLQKELPRLESIAKKVEVTLTSDIFHSPHDITYIVTPLNRFKKDNFFTRILHKLTSPSGQSESYPRFQKQLIPFGEGTFAQHVQEAKRDLANKQLKSILPKLRKAFIAAGLLK